MSSDSVLEAPTHAQATIYLGRREDGSALYYDVARANNFNLGLAGYSGSGKTHTIKRLIAGFALLGTTQYVLDIHGDLDTFPGVDQSLVHTIQFGYRPGCGTINPMRVLSTQGPTLAIRQLEDEVVARFAPQFGINQMRVMRSLLQEAYQRAGIDQDDPQTWGEAPPTLQDVYAIASGLHYDKDSTPPQTEGFATINPSDRPLAACVHTLEDICNSGLFGPDTLAPKGGRVNRFVLTDVADRDRQAITHLLLDRVFNVGMRGEAPDNPSVPRHMVWLDEGKTVKGISVGLMSPVNRIATEGRKFGLGCGIGVQSHRHLTEDTLDNCSLFVVLRQQRARSREAAKTFGVEESQINRIQPRRSALVQQNDGPYELVHLFQS